VKEKNNEIERASKYLLAFKGRFSALILGVFPINIKRRAKNQEPGQF
jgi:hypothetical protein